MKKGFGRDGGKSLCKSYVRQMMLWKKAEAFKKKVIKRLDMGMSNYPKIAVSLSGGIDSGLVTALSGIDTVITVKLPYGKKYDEFNDAKRTAKYLGKKQIVVELNDKDFDKTIKKAVKILGRTTTHFSLFPLYKLFEKLNELGYTDVVFGDGPDEAMCGYIRNIMLNYIYNAPKNEEIFEQYNPMFKKSLPEPYTILAKAIDKDSSKVKKLMEGESLLRGINKVEMKLTRDEVGGMVDALAEHFGITVHRPYITRLDEAMFNLPDELKIHDNWGKYALRLVAEEYLPSDIVWRRQKMGGPVYPVNVKKGWMKDGEFDKKEYVKFQKGFL